ncbi:hypothetical protein [Catenulispora pinisilvae]|uniref:hypothetical protein n=1 Tax=Catenulispora pinisilvae TaxID=2705253 RepID=UPI001890EB1F|nr:hypothetical protein [Catenulispora pinisilvae]
MSLREAGQRSFKPLVHPAGSDTALAAVLGEVAAGRWRAMADLLSTTDPADHQLRCTRTLLLARVAAPTDAVASWRRDCPRDHDALAMSVRVGAERVCALTGAALARAAHPMGDAVLSCREVQELFPHDPVAYLSEFALACVRGTAEPGPPDCPVRGPWRAFTSCWRTSPWNRETVHRMHDAIVSASGGRLRPGDGQLFARSLSSSPGTPAATPLRVLPLVSLASIWHTRKESRWAVPAEQDGEAVGDVERAWIWFCSARPETRLVADLSFLAHALWEARDMERAAMVFEALGPYGAPRPWEQVAGVGRGTELLVQARAEALAAVSSRTSSRPARPRPHPKSAH